MNKKEMVAKVSDEMGVSKNEATLAVDVVLGVMKDAITSGEKVSMTGFGVFEVVKRNARKCRNLQDGSTIDVPAKMAPKFRPAKALKEAVAELPVE